MELLAPAGGKEQLKYAILFGADAVYLACDTYGMRSRAANFSLEELSDIVKIAHEANVKVHLTCNVMMTDDSIASLPSFLQKANNAGVDALIVGDIGAVSLANRYAPDVELHISTQGSVCNSESAKLWYQMGATRIIAAREMSLKDIEKMKTAMPKEMELEVFAHGALCMGYSGKCLLSDFANGKSGIYGNCSQPCRWRYLLTKSDSFDSYAPVDDSGFVRFLNAEDLCMIDYLDNLKSAGVDSIKIEGRTKKAYYVACVTNAYRQVLNGASPAAFKEELNCVCHRPYSTGFNFGRAHQTEELVYTRKTFWAAQVIRCIKINTKKWQIEFKCRSKFSPRETMELLSPYCPIQVIQMECLQYDPNSRHNVLSDKTSPEWTPESFEPVEVSIADHPAENYFAIVDACMHENDIIRVVR